MGRGIAGAGLGRGNANAFLAGASLLAVKLGACGDPRSSYLCTRDKRGR